MIMDTQKSTMENKDLGTSPVKRVKFICTNGYNPQVRLIIKSCH